MILLIDNYDSFSYNLYQFLGIAALRKGDAELKVVRNDELSVAEIAALRPSHLVISPGPGYPAGAGIIEAAVSQLAGAMPILGVCLGHQAICEAFGAKIVHAKELVHGKSRPVSVFDSPLWEGLPETIQAARYHSLAADPDTMPASLKVIGKAADEEIMAVQHAEYPVFGIQFHPESILTEYGQRILDNFLEI
ncbi:MAG: aminodeoxychorismate/anthranilate synthase component II [Propionibacteriaceae bacterium]|jgi:anthranilate synthase component 2|nr:aminodeoxychorismate/anthranilate synthase component II [Propionibacteriaceae bacterium]